VVAGLAVLLLAVVLVLRTPWAGDRAREELLARVNDALDGELHVDRLEGSMLRGAVLHGVRLTREGQEVFSAARVRVDYDPLRLWREGLVFDVVELERPTVHLVESADGWNITKLIRPRPEDASDPTDFAIANLRLTDARVDIQPLDGPRRTLDPVSLAGRLAFEDGRFELQIAQGSARDTETGLTAQRLEGEFSFDEGLLAFRDFTLDTDTGSRVAGSVQFETGAPRASLVLDVDTAPLRLHDLAAYVPVLADLPPGATLTAELAGEGGAVAGRWQVTSDAGGAAGTLDARLAGETITASGQLETSSLDLGPWLRRPDLQSQLDATATFDATVPSNAPEAATVRFTTRSPRVELLGYRATNVAAKGSYDAGRLDANTSGSAYGATFDGRVRWARETGAVGLDGRYAGLDLRNLPPSLDVPPLETRLAGTVRLEGGDAGWHGSSELGASTVAGAGIAEGAVVTFDTRSQPLAYTFDGTVTGLDPSRLTALGAGLEETLARYAGTVNAEVSLDARGTSLETLAGTAGIRLTDTTVAGVGVDTAVIDAAIDDRALSATVEASVREVSDVVLRLDDAVPFRTSGTIDGTVRIPDITAELDVGAMSGRARVVLGPTTVQGAEFDRARADVTLDNGLATVTAFEVTGADVEATAAGTIALDAERRADLTYRASLGDLAILEPFIDQPLSGVGFVEGRLTTGPADRAQLVGTFSVTSLEAAGVSVVEADGQYDVVLPDFDAARATGRVTAKAAVIDVRGTALERAQGTVTFAEGSIEVDAEVVDAARTLQVAGMITPEGEGHSIRLDRLSASTGGMTWQLAGQTPAFVEYQPERLAIRALTLANGEARIHVDGVLGDTAGAPPLVARLERVRLDDLSEFLPDDRRVTGALDGRVTVTGSLAELAFHAEVTATSGLIEDLEYESIGGTVDLAGQLLTVDVRLEAGPLGQFAVAGSMPSPVGGSDDEARPPYALSVTSSEVSLGFLQPLTTAVADIAGTGQFDIEVTGPAEEPSLDGRIVIANGAFLVTGTGVPYTDLNADLLVRGQQVVVERLSVLDDDGHEATVQGELNLPGIGPPTGFELYVTANEVQVLENEYGEVELSAQLTVMGDLQTPLISGTISIDRGVIEASDLLNRLSARGYQRAPLGEGEDLEAGSYDRSSVSITLEMPDNVIIRGRDLRSGSGPLGLGDINVTVGGALTIAKETGERPDVLGSVSVVRGNYQFQGRQFAIQRDSQITFQGSPTNPALNVDAERVISGVTANVHLGGTLQQPELVLSSNPPLDQGDILSLIVFNQAMNELPTEQRVSLAARAGVLAAGAIATPLSDSVRSALDLDTFEIRPGETAASASVIVGRQVSERLFVGFRHEFGADEASQVSFEYRVSELLRIVTSLAQGTEGRSLRSRRTDAAAIDLIFVIR
jgi:translocation and assembly module TamB